MAPYIHVFVRFAERRSTFLWALAISLLPVGMARADETVVPAAPEPVADAPVPETGAPEKKKKKKKDKEPPDPTALSNVEASDVVLEIGGRVLVRGVLEHVPGRQIVRAVPGDFVVEDRENTFDVAVPDARLQAKWTWKSWLSMQVEGDFGNGSAELRDGYVQAKGKYLSARIGQFRAPISSFQLTSIWRLPMVRRGFLNELINDKLDIGGRRPGAQVQLRGRGWLDPSLLVAAFQGSVITRDLGPGTRRTELVDEVGLSSQTLIARAGASPAGVDLGLWYAHRVGSPGLGVIDRYWTAGLDASWEGRLPTSALRVWGDLLGGAAWYELDARKADGRDPTFLMLRGAAAWRYGGLDPGAFYVEPYVVGGFLNPDTAIRGDRAFEATSGINIGYWARARLTAQVEWNKVRGNFPQSYYLAERERTAFILQAGAAF